MMGCDPYKTRAQLVREVATGIVPEVDAATEERLKDGHRYEALARPLAEQIVGEDLFPVTGTEGKYSASFDGLTLLEDTAFEHKSLNDTLREAMVEAAPVPTCRCRIGFRWSTRCWCPVPTACCSWHRSGTLTARWSKSAIAGTSPDLELRVQIEAAWAQFEADVAAYEAPAALRPRPPAVRPTLPALSVVARGMVGVLQPGRVPREGPGRHRLGEPRPSYGR